MSYKHLNTFERGEIGALWGQGMSIRGIAREMDRSPSTISRELGRNAHLLHGYIPVMAQEKYLQRRKNSRPKGKWNHVIAAEINWLLENITWSPEQIWGRMYQGRLSFKTIYRWLYQGMLVQGNKRVLRRKGKRMKSTETRGSFRSVRSIHTRPAEINSREAFGHWELDTVLSSRKSKGCFATFVERKTRMYLAIPMKDRTSESMEQAIEYLATHLPYGAFLSATVDRGKEFACYANIEDKLNIPMYFADPYSSWQRGSNENANGLLREFFPKKTDLAGVSLGDLGRSLRLIANRPRKCLGWKTAYEAFMDELSKLNIKAIGEAV